MAIDVLREAGFQNLGILDGSMQRWRAEKRPMARPASRQVRELRDRS